MGYTRGHHHHLRSFMRRHMIRFSVASIALIALIAALLGLQFYMGNEHTSVPGELYRSAQPTGKDIELYTKRFGIKSIINLRGENATSPWYIEEVATAKALGITHINFRMKAARELTTDQALQLIEVMRNAPKPLLIHCRAGADRTGLAAALYIAAISKGGEEAAEDQLSLRYGHLPYFPFFWTEAQAMYYTFERMEPLLGFMDS
jgi:protein tyrosine/serine phosphatase